MGLRGPQPRLPPVDGRRGADRAAEEPLLGDREGPVPRRRAVRSRAGICDRTRGGGDGKPSAAFFELALGELGVSADHAAMVGDDVEADVAGAMDAGLAGILVTTGKYREDLVRSPGSSRRRRRLDRRRAAAALDLSGILQAEVPPNNEDEKGVKTADAGRWRRLGGGGFGSRVTGTDFRCGGGRAHPARERSVGAPDRLP